ncbi:hypothetical protein ATCC90586_010298 [Pythium insidiosum]|nr:hypothetical protein ATCC90586_010298 [Pythium insidiosum]
MMASTEVAALELEHVQLADVPDHGAASVSRDPCEEEDGEHEREEEDEEEDGAALDADHRGVHTSSKAGDSDVDALEKVRLEGYLRKRYSSSLYMGSWRYCVLQGAQLRWFMTRELAQQGGPLRGEIWISGVEPWSGQGAVNLYPHAFAVRTSTNRVVLCSAKTSAEKEQWISALQRCVALEKSARRSGRPHDTHGHESAERRRIVPEDAVRAATATLPPAPVSIAVSDLTTVAEFMKSLAANPLGLRALTARRTDQPMTPHEAELYKRTMHKLREGPMSLVKTIKILYQTRQKPHLFCAACQRLPFYVENCIDRVENLWYQILHLVQCCDTEFDSYSVQLFCLKRVIGAICRGGRNFATENLVFDSKVFGESWEERKERIRQESPHGDSLGWQLFSVIVKTNDDLRQEVFTMQLLNKFKSVFEFEGLDLWLRTYRIVATGANIGLLETINDACSIDHLKKSYNGGNLSDYFRATFGEPSSVEFKTAQRNFIRSMAAYSIVTYLLLVKDRHNGNILLTSDGHIIHIDFGFILGIAPGGMLSIEDAPFKLTTEMVDVMGGLHSPGFARYRQLIVLVVLLPGSLEIKTDTLQLELLLCQLQTQLLYFSAKLQIASLGFLAAFS